MARKRVVQWFGNGQEQTVRALEVAFRALRASGLPVVVSPPSAEEAASAGIWVQGDEGAVGEFATIFERMAQKAGLEIAAADFTRVGK